MSLAPCAAQETPERTGDDSALPAAPAAAQAVDTLPREDASRSIARAAEFLVAHQGRDGSWGSNAPESTLETGFALETYYAWKMASHGIVCMALAAVPETPARRAAFEDAVRWLCTHRLPTRDSDWDIDFVWTALYGFVATQELLGDPRLASEEWQALLRGRANAFLDVLVRNQALSGGWAYYDDPPFDIVPTWATSFCTALVLPALAEARSRGFEVPASVVERAERYLRRCALPNGAYSYDLDPVTRISGVEHINLIEGSLGRMQVANWARRRLGDPKVTDDVLREGLTQFFRHRAFLDHARTRPIPHEGFHANAGYFYFFAHYYAAKVINELPEPEREAWHARLRPHLVKTQWESGGACDFLDSPYTVNAGTSFLILALSEGLPPYSKRAPVGSAGAQAPAEGAPTTLETERAR
ncbi:MAG: hypothetical protein R3F49_00595 [Planctomycetota bacterium]